MTEKIFSDVSSAKELANILICTCEDDLVKYDRDSRQQFCAEIRALCRKFSVTVPRFADAERLESQQDLYDEQAELRGVEPQSPLDYLNEELDMDFKSFDEFRKWREASAINVDALKTAVALSQPDDEETAEFLRPVEEEA
jgi:hypothetical protein